MAARLPLLLLLALLASTGCLGQEADQVQEAFTAASPQEVEQGPATTPTDATAAAVNALSANTISTGTFNPARKAPRVSGATERHPMLTAKPDLTAMSASDLAAAFSGAASSYGARSSEEADSPTGSIAAQANGAGGATFADSRFGSGTDYTSLARARVGKLWMRFGGSWSMCTASVINKALVVTAAHCVCNFGLGANCFPDKDTTGKLQVYFEPGLDGSTKPYGTFWAKGIMVPPPYVDGTDVTDPNGPGVSVNNDVALVWLGPNSSGKQVSDAVGGYFGYRVNAWGFSAPTPGFGFPAAPASSMLTQFGYPFAFDSGNRMQIGHAATYVMTSSNSLLKNYIRGSAMTGGSSGGPWIANYGVNAALNAGAGGSYGSNSDRNIILAVTSWGYTDSTYSYKVQGASMFGNNAYYPQGTNYGTRGTGNIAKLMYDACDNTALTTWNLKSKGFCI